MAARHWHLTPSQFRALPPDEQEWMEASFLAERDPRTDEERLRDQAEARLKSVPPSHRRPSRPA